MPARVHFAFNKAKSYTVEDKILKVLISPPKIKITAENKRYLQILDLLEIFGKAPIEVEDPFRFMSDLIEKLGLEYKTLLYFAVMFYNREVLFRLVKVAQAEEDAKRNYQTAAEKERLRLNRSNRKISELKRSDRYDRFSKGNVPFKSI